jgi:hypothetical protein
MQLGRLVVLDTWIEVLDRQRADGSWNLLVDQSSGQTHFVVIDQGLSLSEPLLGALAIGTPVEIRCPQPLLPYVDWDEALAAVEIMLTTPREDLYALLQSIPNQWGINDGERHKVVDYLESRREPVANVIRERAGRP